FFAGRIAEIERTEISGFEFDRDAAFFLIVGERLANERFVASEICGKARNILLLLVASKDFFLQGHVDSHVAVLASLCLIVEGEEERVDKEDPVETLGIEIRSESDSIGETSLNIQLVQDAVEVGLAAGSFGGFFLVDEPFGVRGREIVVGIAEERFRGGNEFW